MVARDLGSAADMFDASRSAAIAEDDEYVRRLQAGQPGPRRGPARSTPADPPRPVARAASRLPARGTVRAVRGRLVSCIVVLTACGAAPEPSSAPAPSTVPAPEQPADPVPARAAIGGRLRAHDGAPLRAAEFGVYRNSFREAAVKGPLAADGSFHGELAPGVYTLVVSAVDHAQLVRTLLIDRPIDVRGNLGTYERLDPGDVLQLRTEWLGPDGQALASEPRSARRDEGGTYRLDLGERPAQAVTLRYQIDPGNGRTYNGPLADSHVKDDGGDDYWSVVGLAGRDTLVLDLAALPPAGRAAQVTWTGERPDLLAMHQYRVRWNAPLERLHAAIPKIDGKVLAPSEAQRAEQAALAAEALAEVDAAADTDARTWLRLTYLDLFATNDDAGQSAHGEWVLDHVDPLDPRLGLVNVDLLLRGVLKSADPALLARGEAWYARRQDNPEPGVALDALSCLLPRADERGDDRRIAELYTIVRQPRFAGTFMATHLAQLYDPDRILQRGKPFPDFEFAALAGGPPVTRAERAGRLYLLEFWATWCAPCVADMPDVHAAYAKIHGVGAVDPEDRLRRLAPVERPRVEFVFVSLDQSPDVVQKFRDEHWAMPWTHAFIGGDRQTEVKARFGFEGVPTAILVDSAGTIVEVGNAVRGERLLQTLERTLASVAP